MTTGSGLFDKQRAIAPYKVAPGKSGYPGELGDLRRDVREMLAPLFAPTPREYIDPIVGAADSLLAAAATVAAAVKLLPADLEAATLADMANNPRQVVFTTAGVTAADAPAEAVVVGKDPKGLSVTETIVLAQTAAAVTTNNFFSEIESISYPAADGTGATVAIGIGDKLGLTYKPKVRGGGVPVVLELEDGAAADIPGTVTPAGANDLPYGSYTPNSTLNGELDFLIVYEFDPTA